MSRPLMRAGAVALALSLAVTACGANGSSESGAGGGTADVAAAKTAIDPFVRAPSPFPVTTPLAASPAAKRVAFMDCGTPICALFFAITEPAAQALGIELTRIDTGQAADTVSTAFDSVVTGGYDGVFVPGISPALWERGLDALHEAGVPVVTTGMTGGDPDKIAVRQLSEVRVAVAAKLLAAYLVAEHGPDVNAVLYRTPELDFTVVLAEEFKKALDELCDGCQVREADIPAASLGNRAPSIVTDDLQAHPDTETLVFSVGEQANGLAAAMKTADLDKEEIAFSPTPETLQQVKDGDMDQVLGLDLSVIGWTTIDSLAKLMTGQEVERTVVADNPVMQFLGPDDLTGDVSQGWTGYPDFPERFMELWKAAL